MKPYTWWTVAFFSKWRFPPLRKRCICFCVFFPFCKCDIRTTNVLYKKCNQYPLCPYLQVSDLFPQEWKSSVCCSLPSFSWPVLRFLHKMNWQMSKVNQNQPFFKIVLLSLFHHSTFIVSTMFNTKKQQLTTTIYPKKSAFTNFLLFCINVKIFSHSYFDFLLFLIYF